MKTPEEIYDDIPYEISEELRPFIIQAIREYHKQFERPLGRTIIMGTGQDPREMIAILGRNKSKLMEHSTSKNIKDSTKDIVFIMGTDIANELRAVDELLKEDRIRLSHLSIEPIEELKQSIDDLEPIIIKSRGNVQEPFIPKKKHTKKAYESPYKFHK